MPAALISRDEVLKRLAVAFRQDGYDGASISRLSASTGLGKASLYHYFPRIKGTLPIGGTRGQGKLKKGSVPFFPFNALAHN